MKWQLQLLRAGLKKSIPFKPTLRKLKRQISGYRADTRNLDTTLSDAYKLVAQIKLSGRPFKDAVVLEIGSGWFPIFPIIYALLGAKEVILTDLSPYMDEHTFLTAKQFVVGRADEISSNLGVSADHVRNVLQNANSAHDLGFSYQIGRDAGSYPPSSVDIISSRTVLEHIPERDLKALLVLWKRLLTPSGVMVHAIDMSDHMEHLDKSISRIHFLQFNPFAWAVINSIFDYQNRMRYSQFLELFDDVGLRIGVENVKVDQVAEGDARRLRLSEPYNYMAPEDVGVLNAYLLLEARR